jgi:branched-chain amino acid transport system permease protein
MSLQEFLQHLSNGCALGSLYALIAIGYTMVYGILRLINFAHGDVFMMGAYFAFYLVALLPVVPWWVAFPSAVLLCALLGVVVDLCAYRPLRTAPRISALISAIGVSFFLENVAIVVFSGRPKAFPRPEVLTGVVQLGEVRISAVNLCIPAVAAICLVVLVLVVYRTRAGLGMRAVAHDLDTARLMGVDVNRIITLTFALGSALAGVGGIMYALKYPQIEPLMGVIPGLKAFIAAILGGIGSIPGAMLGGLILGLAEIMLIAFFPELTGYRDAFAFLILILVLLVRPTGILGRATGEKA